MTDPKTGVTYGSYLALDELLSLQHPRSQPEHPDELLFIVVHQASELWFKAILKDLDGLIASLEAKDAGQSLWHLKRINVLMRIVLAQLSSLETLPPQHFAQFRGYLGTSSGSQSVQFRAIEAASGTSSTSSTTSNRKHGSTQGRPMPSITVGRVARAVRSRVRQPAANPLPAGSATHSCVGSRR